MKTEKEFSNIWVILLSVVAVLFIVIGLLKLILDHQFINGSQYLITAIVFSTTVILIKKKVLSPNNINPMFSLGFIFSVIGLNNPAGLTLYIGLWILGISLFILGLKKVSL